MDAVNLQRMISMAILREVESYTFYEEAAQKVKNETVRETFLELARQEREHESLLDVFRNDPELVEKIETPVDMVVEPMDDLPELTVDMRPIEALLLAIKKENQAAEYYAGLARMAIDIDLQRMCEKLSAMELVHRERLEKALAQKMLPESW